MTSSSFAFGCCAVATLAACASKPPSLPPPTPPQAALQNEVASALPCAGIADAQRDRSLCLDTDEILSIEGMPVDVHGGEVGTGARMVFRAAPGRTAESLKHLIDCQIAANVLGNGREQYPQTSYCPLAVGNITTAVQATPAGFAVDIRPNKPSGSHRIAHTVAHGESTLALARFESAECRGVEPRERAACPFLGPVSGLEDLPAGVRVAFAESVPVDKVLAGMRCHLSFAEARGFTEEASGCPLYVRGLRLARATDAAAIDITVTPARLVEDVRSHVRDEVVFAKDAQP